MLILGAINYNYVVTNLIMINRDDFYNRHVCIYLQLLKPLI